MALLDITDAAPAAGSEKHFTMTFGHKRFTADSAGELISVIIDGYDQIPPTRQGNDEATLARWGACVEFATMVQLLILNDRVAEEKFHPEELNEHQLTALLGDKVSLQYELEHWDHPHVQLTLITTDYAPYTNRVAPTGDIIWFDPSTELTFLRSLADAGLLREFQVNEFAS